MEKRVIKFRAISEDTGKWVYGCLSHYPPQGTILINEGGYSGNMHYCLRESLGEFTGLLDKNGVEIFEGDICLTNGLSNWPVIFSKGCFYLKSPNCNYRVGGWATAWIEVIGNIFEHPHLLIKTER